MKIVLFISFLFTFNTQALELQKCKGEQLCLSSKDQKGSSHYTDALEWVGPKNKILPGLKTILERLKYKTDSAEGDYLRVSTNENANSNKIIFEFNFVDNSKTVEVKITSANPKLKNEDVTKLLEEIKFKYFQREF